IRAVNSICGHQHHQGNQSNQQRAHRRSKSSNNQASPTPRSNIVHTHSQIATTQKGNRAKRKTKGNPQGRILKFADSKELLASQLESLFVLVASAQFAENLFSQHLRKRPRKMATVSSQPRSKRSNQT